MHRYSRAALLVTVVLAVAMMTSACEITPPQVDCSGINQPDMGGLVCLGLNVFAWSASAIAIIVAIILALGGASPV